MNRARAELARRRLDRYGFVMIRTALFATLALLIASHAGQAAERLSLKMLGVTKEGGSTFVNYAMTNREPYPIDFVRVACDLRGRGTIDEAVDIQEDLGAGETVTGQTEFNSDEVFRGRRFACRIAAAFRDK